LSCLCGRKHDGRGFPLLVASVWNQTRWEGGPSCCACVEGHTTEGVSPLLLCLCGMKHDGKGNTPSCGACVEGNMTEGVSPFLSHLCGIKHDRKGDTPSRRICFVFIASVHNVRAKPSFLHIGGQKHQKQRNIAGIPCTPTPHVTVPCLPSVLLHSCILPFSCVCSLSCS